MKSKNCVSRIEIWFCLVLAVGQFGCGSASSSTPPAPITVTVSPSSATVQASGTQQFTATVNNDHNNEGVTWTISPSTGAGTLSNLKSTSVTYNAPTTPPTSNLAVMVTATSVADASKSMFAMITVPAIIAPAITVALTPEGVKLEPGQTQQFIATVSNDPLNGGVTWTMSPATGAGMLSNMTSTAVTYNAPTMAPKGSVVVTLTATSVTDTSKSAAAGITLLSAPQLTITTTSLPIGTANSPYTATLQAIGGTPPITWVLGTGTSLPSGISLASNGTISGTASTPGSSCFDVIAIDSSSPPQDASVFLCIGINSADGSHNSLLKGRYAFLMSVRLTGRDGFILTTQVATAGSFVADGAGNLTSGVYDTSRTGGSGNQTFNGTYTVGADNRGTLSLTVPGGGIGTLALSLGSVSGSGVATKGRIIQFGAGPFDGPHGTGEFELQDSTAFSDSAIAGPYAFELSGWVPNQQFAVGGVFGVDGAGGISGGICDQNLGGAVSTNELLTGAYSIAASSTDGRGTGTLSLGGRSFRFTFYVVSAGKLMIISADQAINPLVFIGQARKQSGPFSSASLSGTSVFSTLATGAATAGIYTFDANGGMTVLEDENNGGSVTLARTLSEDYSVTANGRATVAAGGTLTSVFYLVGPNEGFIFNTDPNGATGSFEPQATGPFTNSSIEGSFFFGNLPPAAGVSGVTQLNAGTINQISDLYTGLFAPVYGQTLEDTYTVSSNGRTTTGSGKEVIYVISPTKFLVFGGGISVAEQ